MAQDTKIQWTDATFNPWRGCSKVSPGCANCYAERGSARNPKVLGVWGQQGTRVLASESMWREPAAWNARAYPGSPRRVFCASLADVFEDWGGQMQDSQERPLWKPAESPDYGSPVNLGPEQNPDCVPYTLGHARARLWWLIRQTPNLRWLLLTKRPENIGRMMPPGDWPNVWLGTTVETQEYAWRIDALAEAPQRVPVRFLSCEPLLGPLSLWDSLGSVRWLIIGGESGGGAREMRLTWVRSLLLQCADAGVPAFVKQMGKVAVNVNPQGIRYTLPLANNPGHGGDPADWLADVNVRRFPHGNVILY